MRLLINFIHSKFVYMNFQSVSSLSLLSRILLELHIKVLSIRTGAVPRFMRLWMV